MFRLKLALRVYTTVEGENLRFSLRFFLNGRKNKRVNFKDVLKHDKKFIKK